MSGLYHIIENRKNKYKSIVLIALSVLILLGLTGCSDKLKNYIKSNMNDSDNRMHLIDSSMEDSESRMMYITADNPQDMADKVMYIIISCDNVDELMEYKSKASSNVTKTRCKEVLKVLDGTIESIECRYIDIDCSEDNEDAKYTINAHYYLTVDGEEYILSFCVIIVDEYEVFRHGLHTLQITKFEDYKPDNHRDDYVLPEQVSGRDVLIFNTPVTSEHHNKLFNSGCGTQYDGRELMEEILFIVENNDKDGLVNLYAKKNVNGENVDDITTKQAKELVDIFGGRNNLKATGGIVDFYFFDKYPSYVDCDGIKHPLEYIMRYIIEADGVEYKLQIAYVSSEDETMPGDYVGIQSIRFIK